MKGLIVIVMVMVIHGHDDRWRYSCAGEGRMAGDSGE